MKPDRLLFVPAPPRIVPLLTIMIWVLASVGGCADPAPASPALGSGAAADSQGGDTAKLGTADAGSQTDSATGTGGADALTDTKTSTGSDAKADTGTSKADVAGDTGKEITVPKTVCGDLFCAEGETCLACPYDCGPCDAVCGDGQCGPTETCTLCPGDCGACANACGNNSCDPAESCKNCPEDCGTCPGSCGDGTCDPGEDCDGCQLDCGKCSNEPCNPFGSQGCKDWEQCFPYGGGELICLGAGKLAKGAGCKALVDCQKGMICINSTCTELCDVTGKSGWGCGGGKQCIQVGQPGKPSAAAGACL